MKCYLCGGNKYETVATKLRFKSKAKVVRCLDCGLIQLSPRNVAPENFWDKKDFEGQKAKVKVSKCLEKMIGKEDIVLEIGCGHGDNIRHLRAKGFNVTGIDRDPSVCDGNLVVCGDIKSYKLQKKPDFVYAMHLLEHLENPGKFMEWLHKNLSDRGRFLLEVPNADDPLRTLYKNDAFERFYWYPYHLFFFNRKTIKMFLARHSWCSTKVEIKQEYGILNHLRWLILRRPGNSLPTVPVLDNLYKWFLTKRLGIGDTLIITGERSWT